MTWCNIAAPDIYIYINIYLFRSATAGLIELVMKLLFAPTIGFHIELGCRSASRQSGVLERGETDQWLSPGMHKLNIHTHTLGGAASRTSIRQEYASGRSRRREQRRDSVAHNNAFINHKQTRSRDDPGTYAQIPSQYIICMRLSISQPPTKE